MIIWLVSPKEIVTHHVGFLLLGFMMLPWSTINWHAKKSPRPSDVLKSPSSSSLPINLCICIGYQPLCYLYLHCQPSCLIVVGLHYVYTTTTHWFSSDVYLLTHFYLGMHFVSTIDIHGTPPTSWLTFVDSLATIYKPMVVAFIANIFTLHHWVLWCSNVTSSGIWLPIFVTFIAYTCRKCSFKFAISMQFLMFLLISSVQNSNFNFRWSVWKDIVDILTNLKEFHNFCYFLLKVYLRHVICCKHEFHDLCIISSWDGRLLDETRPRGRWFHTVLREK